MRNPLLCRLGFHAFRFKRTLYVGTGSLEVCKRCGKGRILHFAGAYQYVDAQAIEARQGRDAQRLDRNDESAVATPCAPEQSA